MKILSEIEVTAEQHRAITALRNAAFPEHQSDNSYFKQLPHMRALTYQNDQLVGYLGLDYRVMGVGEQVYKVLGVIDFCVDDQHRGQGIGSSMLSQLDQYAQTKEVDFIVLLSDLEHFYTANGFQRIEAPNSWLRVHEHKNYGVAFEYIDDLYIKPVKTAVWSQGHVDWLGYQF